MTKHNKFHFSTFKNMLYNPVTFTGLLRFALFAGLFIYTELLFQLLAGTLGAGFFRALFFILLGTALLTLITLCVPKTAAFIISTVAVFCISFLSISQMLYIRIFQEFITIDKMGIAGDAITQFGHVLLSTMRDNTAGIILLLLPVFVPVFLFIIRRFPAAPVVLQRRRRFPLAMRLKLRYAAIPFVALCIIRYSLLIPVASDFYSPLAIRFGQGETGRVSSVRAVGLIATMEIDLLSYFVSSDLSSVLDDIPELPVLSLPSTAPKDTAPKDTAPKDTAPKDTLPTPPPWLGKTNSIDIDFDALIERDTGNRAILQLHEYFSSLEPSAQNEKTGLFEGYNLITISAEAFTKWVIDPELTPTLYMMQHEGIYFENFYSIYGAGTIGGEFALVSGLVPRGSGEWVTNASGKYQPFSFASAFLDIGVQPLAYHNGSHTYYSRHILFPNMGYIFTARGNGMEMDNQGWNASDLLMMELTVNKYINEKRFYTHYMTLSGHSPYVYGNPIVTKNRESVDDLPFSTDVRAYIACQLELEHAVTYLLDRLERAGIAERTVIVIASDHYPYGLEHNKIEELAGKRLSTASSLHENAGIIYVKGMEPEIVSSPAFVPDMVPTVLNLLGLEFDSRFFPGRDVFSDAMPLVFLEGSFITDFGIYTKHNREFTFFDGIDELPEGYIDAILSIEAARKSAVEQIIRHNYFEFIREFIK